MEIEGGFLHAFVGLIPFRTGTFLPELNVGTLSRLVSSGVQKLTGNGLYFKRGGRVCQIEKIIMEKSCTIALQAVMDLKL